MAVKSEDVARHAGVSRSAVSQILNGRGQRFSETTRTRVEEAARDLNYEPSIAGRSLALGSSDIVIAMIPNTTFGGNLQELFESATEELAEKGLTLVLRLSTPTSTSMDRVVAGLNPRAVLSLQPFTDAEKSVLEARGVLAFEPTADGDLNREIGRMQATHLIERGYRRIVFAHLQDLREDPYGPSREQGVKDACSEHGLPEPTVIGTGVDVREAAIALGPVARGSGIACYNDDIAITLMTAAIQRGWNVPADIGLCGMDHTPISQVTNPQLTTLGYDMKAVAGYTVAAALAALGQSFTTPDIDIHLQLFQGGTT